MMCRVSNRAASPAFSRGWRQIPWSNKISSNVCQHVTNSMSATTAAVEPVTPKQIANKNSPTIPSPTFVAPYYCVHSISIHKWSGPDIISRAAGCELQPKYSNDSNLRNVLSAAPRRHRQLSAKPVYARLFSLFLSLFRAATIRIWVFFFPRNVV